MFIIHPEKHHGKEKSVQSHEHDTWCGIFQKGCASDWGWEIKLMDHFMCEQNEGFAWVDAERGRFQTDFFPPIEFPVVPHELYIEKNIPIPLKIYKEVCKIITSGKQGEAGISRWRLYVISMLMEKI